MELEVRHDAISHQYHALNAGRSVGLIDYLLSDDTMIITHTETEPALQGQGIAAQLTRAVLDDARAHNRRIIPQCPYTAHFIDTHPDYADLLQPRN